jgi:hypothetical protein
MYKNMAIALSLVPTMVRGSAFTPIILNAQMALAVQMRASHGIRLETGLTLAAFLIYDFLVRDNLLAAATYAMAILVAAIGEEVNIENTSYAIPMVTQTAQDELDEVHTTKYESAKLIGAV